MGYGDKGIPIFGTDNVRVEKLEKLVDSISAKVESVLNQFQMDLVTWQRHIQVTWNLLNVIIRVLDKKGLLTQDDVVSAGNELFSERGKIVDPADVMWETVRKCKGD